MSFPNKQEAAFSQLYTEYVSNLHAYGTSLGFASDVCMDAIQDVFCKLYLRKEELRDIENIGFYLFRSLRNRLIDLQKQRYTTQTIDDETLAFSIEVSVDESFEDEEERLLLKEKIERLLSLLTNRQREAVYLRHMEELDYEQIAGIMGMNAASVRKLVYRALEVMRKHSMTRSPRTKQENI